MGHDSMEVDSIEESIPEKRFNQWIKMFSRNDFQQGRTIGETKTGGKIKAINIGDQEIVCKEQRIDSKLSRKRTFSELVNFEYLSVAGDEGLVSDQIAQGTEHICKFHGHHMSADRTYIFMEKGEDAFNFIARKRQPLVDQWEHFLKTKGPHYSRVQKSPWEREVTKYARHLALGLRYIHSLGFCHGDFKIENILLCKDDKFKLIDFEFMRPIRQNDTCKFGTTSYSSWEFIQCRCNNSTYDSGLNDIWCFGLAIFIMMCGHPAFSTVHDDRFTLITQGAFPTREGQRSFEEVSLEMQNKGLSPDLAGLISAANIHVTDNFVDFICMFFQPESKRCGWEQILTHPWFALDEGFQTSLYYINNFKNTPIDEQMFEAILNNFPFLLDEKSCQQDNFGSLLRRCVNAVKGCIMNEEFIIDLVTLLYPQKAKQYAYHLLSQKYWRKLNLLKTNQ